MFDIEMKSSDESQFSRSKLSDFADLKNSEESRPPEETFMSKTETSQDSLEQQWIMAFDETTERFYWYER
jgi:hypothetical protein